MADTEQGRRVQVTTLSDISFRCDNQTKCHDPHHVMYDGVCRDVFEDGVCGPEAVGERLYLGEDGQGHCDCAEGWVRYEGRCWQEFTQTAFCPDKKILRLSPPDPPTRVLNQLEQRTLRDQFRLNFSCVDNPCRQENIFSLPHLDTWSEERHVCHRVTEDLTDCEVVLGKVIDDGPSPLVCCHPENRSKCPHDGELTPFSITLNCSGSCKCPKGMIWSRFTNKCVRKYSARIIN